VKIAKFLRQIPLEYAVRNLGRSPVRTVLSVGACVLVVLLVVISTAFIRGMNRSLLRSGSPNNVILLNAGSEESVERSQVTLAAAGAVSAYVDGARRNLGVEYVSPELHLILPIGASRDEAERLGVIRGVTPTAFLVHPQVRVTEGRLPRGGQDEVMVGSMVAATLGADDAMFDVGERLWFDGRPWTIAGHFEAPGTVMDGEIWMPLADLQVVGQRQDVSCVVLTLDPAAGGNFADVEAFTAQRLDLELVALREDAYYGRLVGFFAPIRYLVAITAGLCAFGGILGGLNALYAAFAERRRELGTLQVLGFSRMTVSLALYIESLLIASVGALLAGGLGKLLLDGVAVRLSIGTFGLLVDGLAIACGIAASLLLGTVATGAVLLRFQSTSIPEALRS